MGLSKQRNSYLFSTTFLCFLSPTAFFASQHNLFRTMWPDSMKGQLRNVYWLLNTDTKILIFYFQCHVSPAKKPKVASKTESSAQQWNNNHLITGPKGNSEFCFPETLSVARGETMGTLTSRGSKTHFPAELAIKCFVIPPNSKIENKTEKIVCLTSAGRQICCSLPDLVWVESSSC